LLHPTPLLSPELLRLSIRLHLSLHLSFPSLPSYDSRLADAVAHVLEDALLMNDSQSGTAYGWKSLILSVLVCPSSEIASSYSCTQETPGDKVSLVLHPSLPPMVRPQPPLSALHFFAPENEEEKRIRLEMGFGTGQDGNGGVMNEMEVDGTPEREEPVINGQGTGIFDNGLNYGSTSVEQREIPGRDEGDHMAAQAGLLVAVGEVPAPTATVTQNITSPRPDNTSTRDEPAVPAEAGGGDTVPFVSTPLDKGKSKLVEPEIRRGRLSDSPIPELDSGSSDFGDMEDDDEDEEDDEG